MIYLHLIVMCIAGIVGFCCFIDGIITENEMTCCISLISGIVCIILLAFFIIGSSICANTEWNIPNEPYAVEHIMALNDNNMVNGRFYLRRGYIEEDLYYQYMVKLGNGGFKANKVKSSYTTLFYDNDNYRVEWYKKTRSWLYFTEEEQYWEIYIPEGSLVDDYTVDLN